MNGRHVSRLAARPYRTRLTGRLIRCKGARRQNRRAPANFAALEPHPSGRQDRCHMTATDSFRIGTGAGFSADRLDPAVDLARRGRLNVMVLECLGERTVAFAHRDRLADPKRGYNPLLERRMGALLPLCRAAGTVIVTNMGAANPRAAVERTRDIARELGLTKLKIACIEGDDVGKAMPAGQAFMDEPGTLADLDRPIVSMNAYLGADAIVPALAAGANVVIGGRLADPSMYLAPLIHRFCWQTADLLGAGTLVGHLMECGMQV